MKKFPEYDINTLKVLIYNSADAASREFLTTIPAEEWATFSHIISWYDPAHYELTQWYLENCHFPSMSTFPCILMGLPRAKTFAEEDEVILIEPKRDCSPTYKDYMDEADGTLVLSIVASVMQTESYKLSFLREAVMLDATIPIDCFQLFSCARTVREFKIMYSRLAQEKRFVRNPAAEAAVKEELNIDLGGVIELNTPEERVLVAPPPRPQFKVLEFNG